MTLNKTLFFLLIIGFVFPGCGNKANDKKSTPAHPERITIATAANMQFAMKVLTQEFTDMSNIQCNMVIGSSGNLTAQIKEGAPYDIFVAANMKYPNTLFDNGLTEAPPTIYASGRIILWSMMDDVKPSLNELTTDQIKHISIANPKFAPYGSAAIQVLQRHDLLKKVRHKLVYGESIAQTNQFITSRSAEAGFTAMAVVLSPEMKGKGRWTALDPETYSPIDQGVVIIKHKNKTSSNSKSGKSAPQKFFDFLFSAKAKEILKDFGYLVNE